MWRLLRRPVFQPVIRRVEYLLRFWYALRLEGRSGLGHIQTLLSKKHWGVDLGSPFERLPDGRLIACVRTDARNQGMQKLESDYPWASTIDLEIFLKGFHAGEQYALGTLDRQLRSSAAVGSPDYSKGSNSMPPVATQQDSKHDL